LHRSRLLPAIGRCGGIIALRRARESRTPPDTRVAASARRAVQRRTGRASARAGARRGPARRTPRLPSRRACGRVLAILLSRRHLRFRRRAERIRTGIEMRHEASAMFAESAEAPHVVASLLEKNRARAARLAKSLRALAPRAVVTGARGSSDNAATF